MAKAVLWIVGLVTLGFGLWSLLAPASVANIVQFGLTTPAAMTEMRAFYGGIEIGLGLYWIFSAQSASMQRPALLAMSAVWLGVAGARAIGMLIDGGATGFLWAALATETASGAIAWLAYRRG